MVVYGAAFALAVEAGAPADLSQAVGCDVVQDETLKLGVAKLFEEQLNFSLVPRIGIAPFHAVPRTWPEPLVLFHVPLERQRLDAVCKPGDQQRVVPRVRAGGRRGPTFDCCRRRWKKLMPAQPTYVRLLSRLARM